MFKVKSRHKIARLHWYWEVLENAEVFWSGYRIRSIRGSINQIQGKQKWFFFFDNLMFDTFCLLFSEISPTRVRYGAHIFPEIGKGISEKGERVGKERGGAGVLARKTVKEVKVDFDLAGSKKSFKQDWAGWRQPTCGQAKVSRMVLGFGGVKSDRKEKFLVEERHMNWCRMSTWSNLWDLNQTNYFLMHEHYDQFLFCLGVKKHCLWRFEGEDFGECPRRSVAGAWSRVGALGCWRSYGAVFATFQQLENGTMYSVHGL